jgi:YidC/Oxa1 family membrane protein insertase
MNNKRSPIEQFLLVVVLALVGFQLSQYFFGPKKNTDSVKPREAPALDKAFADLNNGSKEKAATEVTKLQKDIEANSSDEYAAWAHLRIGLLKQYVLRNDTEAVKAYDDLINRHQNKAVDAQAIYQKGDLLWRQSEQEREAAKTADPTKTPPVTAQQIKDKYWAAASTLEQISLRARGHQDFLDTKIHVPTLDAYHGDPLALPSSWEQLTLTQLRGNLPDPDPRAILTRVDEYYANTPALMGLVDLHGLFDATVRLFGSQPSYSYGLALLLLAIITRTLMQPFIKKQYDSMKGMSVIAPEMKKIQEKYKGKPDAESQRKMMQEIRSLQKSHGVNPMGCGLSMLVQMPVFFFFVLPLINHYQAKLELVGAHFGWVHSLARPDIPLLVLYAISMFISVRLSSTPPADEQQRQMQKMTTLMAPLFAVVLWSYPSAFILYWLAYNVLSMFFQWRMMKKAEPEKNLVKTLIGGAPPLATNLSSETSAPGALPSRPKKGEKAAQGEATVAKGEKPVAQVNGEVKDESKKNNRSGSGAQRARRRRR